MDYEEQSHELSNLTNFEVFSSRMYYLEGLGSEYSFNHTHLFIYCVDLQFIQLVEVLIFYAWLAKFPLCLWPTVG